MEQQNIFDWHLPTTTEETKWATLQARVTPEEKEETYLTCRWLGLKYSVAERIIWRILNHRRKTMPQCRGEVLQEINGAVEQFEVHLPIFKRQKEIAPRMF